MANHNSAQSGLMGTYDANDTYFMADGKEIFGWATDSMFTIAFDNENETVAQDPQGTAVASINNKTGATITVNLQQMSPCNSILDQLAKEHRKGGFTIDAFNGSTHYTGTHAYISKIPDGAAGSAAGDRAWQIHVLNLNTEETITF